MGASQRVTIPSGPVMKKGLAGEGKTFECDLEVLG
jgi:hypothetical protein